MSILIKNVIDDPRHIGLVDADLLSKGTRHPNLALLKLAGYLRDNGYKRASVEGNEDDRTYELLDNDTDLETLDQYDHIYVSCVFSFTYEKPSKLFSYLLCNALLISKVTIGGTGSYGNLPLEEGFAEKREKDFHGLERDPLLLAMRDGGIDMKSQMPDYQLYDEYIRKAGAPSKYKDYQQYSIGFLTRGCFRQCPFCVNKMETRAMPYSRLSDFLDNEVDAKTGKLKRPYIYLWDDNFLASPHWEEMLDELIATGRPFQFRQGLDERLIAQSGKGELMARKLAGAKYHGDYIFAFDHWKDRRVVEKALKVWKRYNPDKETKFYLFCGFRQSQGNELAFQQDVAELFMRIKVLMSYGCLGYVMRHEDYKKSPLPGIYVQIARWCNQPGFFRNMSFWEFCYENQAYYEKTSRGIVHDHLKSFDEFMEDYEVGYYKDIPLTASIRATLEFLQKFPTSRGIFLSFFNMKLKDLKEPGLWKTND